MVRRPPQCVFILCTLCKEYIKINTDNFTHNFSISDYEAVAKSVVVHVTGCKSQNKRMMGYGTLYFSTTITNTFMVERQLLLLYLIH